MSLPEMHYTKDGFPGRISGIMKEVLELIYLSTHRPRLLRSYLKELLLNNWKITDKEEEVIGFAEDEANKIIDILGFDKKEQPKKGFFKK